MKEVISVHVTENNGGGGKVTLYKEAKITFPGTFRLRPH